MSEFNFTYAEVKQHILNICFNKSGNIKKQLNLDSFWYSTNKRNKSNLIKTKILHYILKETDDCYNITTRVMLYLSKEKYLSCRYCGEKIKNNSGSCYCSNDHARKHGEIIKKHRLQEKYGVINVFQLKDVIEKSRNTCFEKYGVKNVSILDKNKEKARQYRIDHKEELLSKTIETWKKNGGPPSRRSDYIEKVKRTCLSKYGVDHHTKTNNWKQWRKNNDPTQKHLNMDILLSKEKMKELYENGGIDAIKAATNCQHNCAHVYLRYHGITQIQSGSSYEMPYRNLLNELNISYITNTRKIISPLEIDIYIESHNIGIEVNGSYWHANRKHYHKEKTDACESKGIQLFHIFDFDSQEKWQSLIKHKLGIYSHKIGARQCDIKEITTKIANEFLEQYHMQGKCPAKFKYGLYYKDELISVMTFGLPRFNKNYDWELLRFCCKEGYIIMGGASKLLNHFRKLHPGSIISYANRRWSNGNLYKKLGFKFLNNSEPNYYYFNGQILYSRYQCQKHKLSKLIINYDENLSEKENMNNNGFMQIWDSGNMVFVIKEKLKC